jgi:hypothetical protein
MNRMAPVIADVVAQAIINGMREAHGVPPRVFDHTDCDEGNHGGTTDSYFRFAAAFYTEIKEYTRNNASKWIEWQQKQQQQQENN